MIDLIARCGFRCDLCLGYRENVERDERNKQVSATGSTGTMETSSLWQNTIVTDVWLKTAGTQH